MCAVQAKGFHADAGSGGTLRCYWRNSSQPRSTSSISAAVPFSTREMAAAMRSIVVRSRVSTGRSSADHAAYGIQTVADAVGVQEDEDRPVPPRHGFELLERRIARGPHLAFVADRRLPDIAGVPVAQPPTHRPSLSGCGGVRSGAASGTAGRRRAATRFRGTTTAPRRT